MDRRDFMISGTALAGLAASSLAHAARASTAAAADLRGPYLDLTTGKGNMLAMVRMNANLDESKTKYGGATGVVCGVRPGEAVRSLFGFEVVSVSRAWKQPDGSYRRLHRECVLYTDLASGQVLTEYVNPYTDERVRVVDVVNDPWNGHYAEYHEPPPSYGGLNKVAHEPKRPFVLPWRLIPGGLLVAQTIIHLYYPSALQPDKWPRESSGPKNQVSEFSTYILPVADMQDPRKTSISYSGTWSRVTPWLPWMLMGTAPGHVLYESIVSTFDTLEGFTPAVLAHMEKHHPEMMEPPPVESWSKPNLSSLEGYARDQKPAPPRTSSP